MTEVLYDETKFPEYLEKVQRDKWKAIRSFLGGVVAYLILATGFVFLLFPQGSSEEKLQGLLILLGIPLFFGILAWAIFRRRRRRPLRITEDKLEGHGHPVLLQDVLELAWMGPEQGVRIRLDPARYRISSWHIRGEDLVRPREFLQALEGRVPLSGEEIPLN